MDRNGSGCRACRPVDNHDNMIYSCSPRDSSVRASLAYERKRASFIIMQPRRGNTRRLARRASGAARAEALFRHSTHFVPCRLITLHFSTVPEPVATFRRESRRSLRRSCPTTCRHVRTRRAQSPSTSRSWREQ